MTFQNIASDANLAGLQAVSSAAPHVILHSRSTSSVPTKPTVALSAFVPPSSPDDKALPPSLCPSPSSNPFEENLFPPASEVLALLVIDRLGEHFGELHSTLLEAGIVQSEQLLLLPEDILSVIGNIGPAWARILRNYAKQIVLPLLGLQDNHKDPEIAIDPKIEEHGHSSEETGAESVINISESGSDDGMEDDAQG